MSGFELRSPRPQGPSDAPPYDRWAFPDGTVFLYFFRRLDGYLLRFPDIADFEIDAACSRVDCSPAPGIGEATCNHLFLNQVQPLILSRTGKLVLHGSAVETGAGALLFLGQSGRGKSTLAASFALRGYPFLADDGIVLERTDAGYRALPSHPSIRLWNDSEEALALADAPRAPPVHYTPKSRLVATSRLIHATSPCRLRTVYLLDNAGVTDVSIRRLDPAAAMTGLLQHTFILDVEDRAVVSGKFDRMADLANDAPCFSLDYPRAYERLADVIAAIVAHASGLPA